MIEIPIFKFAIREDLKDTGDLFLPTRGTSRSTGWDVRAALPNKDPLHIRPGQYVKIPMGFRTLCPDGWWFEVRPRSSTFGKKHLHCLYGVVDEDYEGQLIFACQYLPDISSMGNDLVIEFGEAIGQIIPVKRQEMTVQSISNEEIDQEYKNRNTQRGIGGFGSTGK